MGQFFRRRSTNFLRLLRFGARFAVRGAARVPARHGRVTAFGRLEQFVLLEKGNSYHNKQFMSYMGNKPAYYPYM